MIGAFTAYLSMLDSAGGPGPLVNPFTPEAVANLAISAAWAYVAYVRGVLSAGLAGPGRTAS